MEDDGDAGDTTSFSDSTDDEKMETMLRSVSSSTNSSQDNAGILFANKTFVTCRNPSDSFFLCQVLQDVYEDTKKIRIRWCSATDGADDDTPIDENTRFKLDYTDTLDPQTILTGIPEVIRHTDKTISMRKQDITETQRLLEKSIKGESISSDKVTRSEMDSSQMNCSLEKKTSNHNSSASTQSSTPKTKKKRTKSDSAREQPPKKRVKLGTAARELI